MQAETDRQTLTCWAVFVSENFGATAKHMQRMFAQLLLLLMLLLLLLLLLVLSASYTVIVADTAAASYIDATVISMIILLLPKYHEWYRGARYFP